jgi:hypothetical protein
VTEIMNAQPGSISVDDNPSRGMVFTLRFGELMGERNNNLLPQPGAKRMIRVDPKKDHIAVKIMRVFGRTSTIR